MPVTNEWLAGPAPKARLGRERLEERILNLMSSQNMCVIATTGPEGPLATPVRYFHLAAEPLLWWSRRSGSSAPSTG